MLTSLRYSAKMFRPDALDERAALDRQIIHSNLINVDVISQIERELQDEPYDMVSLVFLLYEVPDTALQKLVTHQKIVTEMLGTKLNLLHDWYQHSKSKPTWKHEFLEALLICQLFNIVRRIGFDVQTLRKHYQTDYPGLSMYVDPLRKILYKICEEIDTPNLIKLQKSLLTYDIDVSGHNICEIILLELMSRRFIGIKYYRHDEKYLTEIKIDKFLRIIENFDGLRKLSLDLKFLQNKFANETNPNNSLKCKMDTTSQQNEQPVLVEHTNEGGIFDINNLLDIHEDLEKLQINDGFHFEADKNRHMEEIYEIKNKNRLGLCLIINQENFYPSRQSIELNNQMDPLQTRTGSTKDRIALEKTMSLFNFVVNSRSDLGHKEMINFIKDNIKNNIHEDDSMFMLCILSHGVRGHIFAADSVKIKVEDIQKLLDSDEAKKLHCIPKVLIIQACQVIENQNSYLTTDSPLGNIFIKKSDFLVYWATAPEYEAIRHITKGTVFIQNLCKAIRLYGNKKHLSDIFTIVNNTVTNYCMKLNHPQVPIYENSLRRALYLFKP